MADWYEHFFSDDWVYVQQTLHDLETTEDTARALIDVLGLQSGDAVLDVPTGEGRVAAALARMGMRVTGVDLSERLLDDARARPESVRWVRADMRDVPEIEGDYDAAVNVWGSFGYFDDAGNLAFASHVCAALKPGGRFLIDSPSIETILPRYQKRAWFEVGDAIVMEERHYEPLTGRMVNRWIITRDGRRTYRTSEIRMYTVAELRGLLEAAGFARVEVHGDLGKEPFAIGRRMCIVATR